MSLRLIDVVALDTVITGNALVVPDITEKVRGAVKEVRDLYSCVSGFLVILAGNYPSRGLYTYDIGETI